MNYNPVGPSADRRVGLRLGAVLLLALFGLTACGEASAPRSLLVPDGDAERGKTLVGTYGCGSCHTIAQHAGADGVAGPPLTRFAQQTFISGEKPNVPAVLVPWLMSPPNLSHRTAMPELGITEAQARDIASYLYTLEADEAAMQPRNVLSVESLSETLQEKHALDQRRLSGDATINGSTISIEKAMELLARNETPE